jgi:hypothetical protein
LTPPAKLLILASAFRTGELFRFDPFFLIQQRTEPTMKNLIALLLSSAVFAAFSFSASAGVAPTAPNSALTQAGAKIAPPARQATEDKDDKKEHQDNTPKDPAK